jgi:3-hydroxyacyl-CoA dehydrogenase
LNSRTAEEKPSALRDREDKLEAARRDPSALDAHAAALTKKARGLEAPHACVRAVRMALDTPFDEALAKEREIFIELMNGDQSKAQRHLFFAEREANKVPGIDRDVRPRKVSKAAVIGAGTMGGGIAMALANGGVPVTILEMNQEAIDRGMAVIQRNYDTSVKRGSISAEERDRRLGRLSTTTDYNDIADADLVIEAVFEEMSVKKVVFGKLDEVMKPGAILASNTSYLDVDDIAQMTKRPADVLGMHFFSPANVMKLLEIVRGKETAPDVIATALALGKQIGKVPVVVGVCHGFVGNRMLSSRSAENESLLLEGASPADVDKAFLDFGFSMGPFAMGDLAGLDIGWRTRKSLGQTAAIGDALCEAGRFGQKTGKGFYSYEDGPRDAKPDPWVDALIEEKARELGVNRRSISAEEIIERTIYPMINEGPASWKKASRSGRPTSTSSGSTDTPFRSARAARCSGRNRQDSPTSSSGLNTGMARPATRCLNRRLCCARPRRTAARWPPRWPARTTSHDRRAACLGSVLPGQHAVGCPDRDRQPSGAA